MPGMLNTTASSLLAILAFINPNNTPKIAYDKDEYAQPLINKLKEAVLSSDGSQPVYISWHEGEEELQRQFNGVCKNIKSVFDQLEYCSQSY